MLKRFVLAFIAGWLLAGIAFAQTNGTPPSRTSASRGTAVTTTGTTSTGGSFASLSPGNQKIARALFEAQTPPPTNAGPTGSTTLTSGTEADAIGPSTLSLDQIAQLKQSGHGWGNVFREMKSQGLVDARSLGILVSASRH
jgi:hypothetical protein